MEELSVPQREVQVRIHLQDGRNVGGKMYVPAVGPDGGPGHLIDRLNEEAEQFVVLTEKQKAHLINESRILMVQVDDDEVEERVERTIEDSARSRHLLVKLQLTSGTEIIGNLAYVQPMEQERLQDYLNSAGRFIPMRVHDRLAYINRDHIVSVLGLRGD